MTKEASAHATDATSIEQLAINTIRTLSMDGVQKANSGHPGTPMALAPLLYVLWSNHLRFDPCDPQWPDRDRFVLSNGHASMLLYSMLHLAGFEVSLEDLKQFRQWGSRTPGHPERGHTAGVEVTTGPLGQGISNAVGLAMAEAMLGKRFNRPQHQIVDHHTYVVCGDGDLMEGVTYEATSLAGRQRLGKLICMYDDNNISIAGRVSLSFTEDVAGRFEALGWHVSRVGDVNDLEAVGRALQDAKSQRDRPSLIIVRSIIGFGSPNRADTKEAHGEPLGEEEVRKTKQVYGWPEDATFLVPDAVREHFASWRSRGERIHGEWNERFGAYSAAFPGEAREFQRVYAGQLPSGWEAACREYPVPAKPEATRESSGAIIQRIAEALPELVGGSADLDPSTKTFIKSSCNFDEDHRDGRNIQYGIREHGMGAVVNGMAAHGGVRPFGATFFVFSDYLRPTLRLAALSGLPSIFVFTHDSVGLGEDGPTHQPIEHLASLRAIPGLTVIRPADARETAEAWQAAIENTGGPTVLVLSRQKLPGVDRAHSGPGAEDGARRGGYVARDTRNAKVTLIGTGSEVTVSLEAAEILNGRGIAARVVSLPSWELFERQEPDYRAAVLGDTSVRFTIEAAATFGWARYARPSGASLGVDRFGASAPGEVTMREFGFTAEGIADRVQALAEKGNR